MRAIIAGGRDYRFTQSDYHQLNGLRSSIHEVVSGGAKGADAAGEAWAATHGIPVKRFPADWDRHGLAAGPLRNKQMAAYASAQGTGMCILFPGGKGTASMYREAEAAGLVIMDFR